MKLIDGMTKIEGGTFTMGATTEQGSNAYSDEKPTHQVTLSDYMIGKTEVTQEQWEAVMGSNPSNFKEVICLLRVCRGTTVRSLSRDSIT